MKCRHGIYIEFCSICYKEWENTNKAYHDWLEEQYRYGDPEYEPDEKDWERR